MGPRTRGQSTAALGLGRVKSPTPNLRVEFPSRFRRCRNQLHWQLLSEQRHLRKQFCASLARTCFHTARVIFDRVCVLRLPFDVRFAPKANDTGVCTENLKRGRSGGEVRQGWRVI